MTEKKFKQICECTKCGNEAKMTVTCDLVEEVTEKAVPPNCARRERKGRRTRGLLSLWM